MKKIAMLIRIVFGFFFLFVGLNYFFHFTPIPSSSPEGHHFILALESTRYMLPLIAGVQILAGFMLAFNIFVPLALLILAPVVLNILLFHIYLDQSMLALAIGVAVVESFLALIYWDHYSHLFKKR